MTMTSRSDAISNALSSRYGLAALNCADWDEIGLFGGVGMDEPTFDALASAAVARGDTSAMIYELESTKIEFKPISIDLDFVSFNSLKGNIISHFDLVMVPPSKAWAALLTNELETFVCGLPSFLAAVSLNAT
ncbi:MAG: hypothetical protein ABIQ36_03990 [Rhodanobacter sp.]